MANILIVGCVTHAALDAELRRSGHRVERHVNLGPRSSLYARSFDLIITTDRAAAESCLDMSSGTRGFAKTPILLLRTRGAAGSQTFDGVGYFITPMDGEPVFDVIDRLRLTASGCVGETAAGLPDIVAEDEASQAAFAHVREVAAVDCNVLISGESGTGKEIAARLIHRHSDRRHQPLVPVNGGGLPDTLVESELFGHRRGAFTGALAEKKGLIEEADKSVLFLDEIGEMPASMQVRLLRFLDSGEVRRVGDTAARHVDVRVIAATNRDLDKAVALGVLRRDLYHRLGVVVRIPPLRERRDDIAPLVRRYLSACVRRLGKPISDISDEAMALLRAHDWPGNIRELRNVVESAVITCTRERLLPVDLPRSVRRREERRALEEEERERLVSALHQCGGHHGRAAKMLSISRTTLWRRLQDCDGSSSLEES